MAKWKLSSERKWDSSKAEKAFEKLLADNDYKVIAIKEWTTQTNYMIEKNGITQEYMVYHTSNANAISMFQEFERYYGIKKDYETLKARWRSCLRTPPKKDGVYLVVRFLEGRLVYAADLGYTVEYGWNTDKFHHDRPIVFDKTNKLNKYAFWTDVTYQRGK